VSLGGHCTVRRGRVGNVKQVGFEPRPEDRCGSDKIRQTVEDAPSACTVPGHCVKASDTSAKEAEVDWLFEC